MRPATRKDEGGEGLIPFPQDAAAARLLEGAGVGRVEAGVQSLSLLSLLLCVVLCFGCLWSPRS